MRWIRFTAEDRTRYGILEGDRILEVSGSPFDGYEKTSRKHDLAAVKIEVPVMPRTFYCAGLNYVEHVKEGAAKRGEVPNIPTKPDMGYRASNALIAHNETVIIPADATEKLHHEGELVARVGKKAKNLSEAEALSCIMGWTIGNDVSERTWQKSDRTFWRSKNTDTFKPMGPWIETDFQPGAQKIITTLNGEVKQSEALSSMTFKIPQIIEFISSVMTLLPGDVILTGTPAGVSQIMSGDSVSVTIEDIGTLTNSVTVR